MALPVACIFVDTDITHCGDKLRRMPTNNFFVYVLGIPVAKFADPNNVHLPPGCEGAEIGVVAPVNNVLVMGDPIARITDPVSCATIVGQVRFTGVEAG